MANNDDLKFNELELLITSLQEEMRELQRKTELHDSDVKTLSLPTNKSPTHTVCNLSWPSCQASASKTEQNTEIDDLKARNSLLTNHSIDMQMFFINLLKEKDCKINELEQKLRQFRGKSSN